MNAEQHDLVKSSEIVLACKKCKKVFRKDFSDEEAHEQDEYCPHCDNHFVIPAKTGNALDTPSIQIEIEDSRDPNRVIFDDRIKNKRQ